jgi:hypothetical protein
MLAGLAQLGKSVQGIAYLAHHLQSREVVAVYLGRGTVYVNYLFIAARVPQSRRPLNQVIADGDYEVGLGKLGHGSQVCAGALEADGSEGVGVAVIEAALSLKGALAHEGMGDGEVEPLHHSGESVRGPVTARLPANYAVAYQHEGPSGLAEKIRGALQDVGPGLRVGRAAHGHRFDVRGYGHGGDVFGQLDMSGARLLKARQPEGLSHYLGDGVRPLDPGVPPGDGPEHLHDVYILVRFFMHSLKPCLAGDSHQRCEVEGGVGDAGDEVSRAGAEGSDTDAGVGAEGSL